MNLIERYALSTGLKIGEPYIYEKFFPLPSDWDKFITFHPTSKPAKTYDFWQDVLDDISPVLERHGYKVVQLGAKDDPKYQKCVNLNGMTTINQVAYMVKRSSLHLSADTFTAHMAGAFDIPLVSLYSSCYAENSKPYWGDLNKQVAIEPNRSDGQKPFFAFEENPKSINRIKSEEISNAVFRLLGLEERAGYETIFVGDKYTNGIFYRNVVPSKPQFAVQQNDVEIRMDISFDEEFLASQLSMAKCAVVTDKPINIDLLRKFKPNVSALFYLVSDGSGREFCKNVINLGIPTMFISKEDQEKINSLKIHYYDYGKLDKLPVMDEKEKERILSLGDLKYKSNKIYTSEGSSFYSIPDMDYNKAIQVTEYKDFKHTLDIWEDFNFFKIIKPLD
jgi:hypothetical protein